MELGYVALEEFIWRAEIEVTLDLSMNLRFGPSKNNGFQTFELVSYCLTKVGFD